MVEYNENNANEWDALIPAMSVDDLVLQAEVPSALGGQLEHGADNVQGGLTK
jgi:hypothetical protein